MVFPSSRKMTFILASLLLSAQVNTAEILFKLEICINKDGTATSTWTDGIAIAVGQEAAIGFENQKRPLSPEAQAWLIVLKAALPAISARATSLASVFDIEGLDATIAVGNRGSSDGFGWVPNYIGINLEAFHDTYGSPDIDAENRMTRIVAHEYLHLLTYAFYPDFQQLRDTALNRFLWTMFFEGIGDYVSASSKWLPEEDGQYSDTTEQTLRHLEPLFIDRLEAVKGASKEQEISLRKGISMGKFNEKWGSLPVALWLHTDAQLRGEHDALKSMIHLGPSGVLPLAIKYAAPQFKARLEKLNLYKSVSQE